MGSSPAPDAKKAEQLLSEQASAYALAAAGISEVTRERTWKVKIAQIALLFSFLLIAIWLGLPAMQTAIAQFNSPTQGILNGQM